MTITAGNFLPLGLWKETVKGSMIIMINWCNEHINRRPMDHRSTHWHFCWRPSFPWNSSAPQAALYQLDQRHLQIAWLMQLTKHWCWGVNSDAADHVKSSYRLLPVSPCRHQQHLKLWTILKRNRHYCSDCCNFLHWFRQSHPKLRQPIRSWLAQKMAFNTILTNAGILFIAPLGTKLSEIQMKIQQLSHKKINFVCKMAAICLGLGVTIGTYRVGLWSFNSGCDAFYINGQLDTKYQQPYRPFRQKIFVFRFKCQWYLFPGSYFSNLTVIYVMIYINNTREVTAET